MLYAILAYHVETEVQSWTPEEDAALMAGLSEAHARINQTGKLGPAARLGGTQKALTLRGPGAGIVVDGPFAETKEQLAGFYLVDAQDAAEAQRIAAKIPAARTGSIEVRPVMVFK